jgi:hypothetical protein
MFVGLVYYWCKWFLRQYVGSRILYSFNVDNSSYYLFG